MAVKHLFYFTKELRINLIKQSAAVLLIFVIFSVAQEDDKPSFLGKHYKLETSEKFDEFLKALDVNWFFRRAACMTNPTVSLTKNDTTDEYSLIAEVLFMDHTIKFKLGEERHERDFRGKLYRTSYTLNDNILTAETKVDGGKRFKIVREFGEKELKAVMTADDVVCTRVFKLVD